MKGTVQYLLIDHHFVTHPVLWETCVPCRIEKLRILCTTNVWESKFNEIISALSMTRRVTIFINGVSSTFWLTTSINGDRVGTVVKVLCYKSEGR